MFKKNDRHAVSGCSLFFYIHNLLIHVLALFSAGDKQSPPSCQYPDWLRRLTWYSLNGQLQFSVDDSGKVLYRKRLVTSSMTAEAGSARGSEYRCRQLSEDRMGYERRRNSATVQLSAFVLHDWSLNCVACSCS